MNKKLAVALAAVSLSVLGLSGCASPAPSPEPAAPPDTSESSDGSGANDLAVSETSLGEIVVDRDGMTVYVFDKDTADSGKSSCSGECLAAWPAVTTESDSPTADGVSGEIGTITRDDGSIQVTLNGLPLYTYAPDEAVGDVSGQGVGGIWWVVAPDGAKIDTAADSSGY